MAKDLKEFTRDRFFFFMSIVGIVFYVAIFWVLPTEVDETIDMGVVGSLGADIGDLGEGGEGISVVPYDSIADLTAAVEEGDEVQVGMALPSDLSDPTIQVFIGPDVPPSLAGAMEPMVTEFALALLGVPPPVTIDFTIEEIVLGDDRAGDQISLQEKFRPMLAFFVLMIESMALAGLVAGEIQARTVKAVTVSPARVSDFLTAKVLFGTALAFVQVVVLLAAIRGLDSSPVILLAAVLLGSVLATGFGLLAGSMGRDFMSIIFYSMAFMIPLLIPAMAMLFPGSVATWIKVIPSWPLAQMLVDITTYGAGWSEIASLFGLLAVWSAVVLVIGWVVLGRRVQTI
jgi:ABC-2 type transport system permease protein